MFSYIAYEDEGTIDYEDKTTLISSSSLLFSGEALILLGYEGLY